MNYSFTGRRRGGNETKPIFFKVFLTLIFFSLILSISIISYQSYVESSLNKLDVTVSSHKTVESVVFKIRLSNKLPNLAKNKFILISPNPNEYRVDEGYWSKGLKLSRIENELLTFDIIDDDTRTFKIKFDKISNKHNKDLFHIAIESQFAGKYSFKYIQ